MTDPHDRAMRSYPVLHRLNDFRQGGVGWRFTERWDHNLNRADLFVGARAWHDDWVDIMTIANDDNAVAWRLSPRDELVWIRGGTVTVVVMELLRLPAADDITAPRQVIPGRAPVVW